MDSLTLSDAFGYVLSRCRYTWSFDQSTTPEQEERDRKAETMYIYNQYAQEFFRAQYEVDNDEAAACRRYAEKRMAQQVDDGIRISAEHSVLATVQQEGTNFFNMQG